MKSSIIKTCLLLVTILFFGCSSDGSRVVIVTTQGNIEIQLYENTPEHKANFVKLAKEGYYDGTLFHRVIKEFMIQGGDPESKTPGARFGSGGPGYTVPAEFIPENFHKRGALAAARQPDQVNPEKASSGSQFYIVQGRTYSDYELDQVEIQIGTDFAQRMLEGYLQEEQTAMMAAGQTFIIDSLQARAFRRASEWFRDNPYKLRAEVRETYRTIGGVPHLDGEYTVFGEVIKGMNVVDKIANMETDEADRPRVDVRIRRIKVK